MPRSNPQVDSCNRTIDLLRKQIERMRQDPPDIPFAGCGDSSCITTDGLGGMHTNGGCRCDERALRRAVSYWRQVAVRRQVAIQDILRGEGDRPIAIPAPGGWAGDFCGCGEPIGASRIMCDACTAGASRSETALPFAVVAVLEAAERLAEEVWSDNRTDEEQEALCKAVSALRDAEMAREREEGALYGDHDRGAEDDDATETGGADK